MKISFLSLGRLPASNRRWNRPGESMFTPKAPHARELILRKLRRLIFIKFVLVNGLLGLIIDNATEALRGSVRPIHAPAFHSRSFSDQAAKVRPHRPWWQT